MKIPKKIDSSKYTLEKMSKELELNSICQHIASTFNRKLIFKADKPNMLRSFIRTCIYEIQDEDACLKYYFAENYIRGQYVKQNNNGGWQNKSNSSDTNLAQALSHFSW